MHETKVRYVGCIYNIIMETQICNMYRVFHNCWDKAIGHKSRILNDTTMMITFIERWKNNIL